MNAQQTAHYKMLAAKHQDTPGDLATAYRVIGELLCEKTSDYITDKFSHVRKAVADRVNDPGFADWYSEYAKNDILDLLDACAYYRAYPELGVEALEQITKERDELLRENEQLQQTIQDYTVLSDAVEELARIEKAYTRLPDNTWPEWDGAYDAMYAINQELRQS